MKTLLHPQRLIFSLMLTFILSSCAGIDSNSSSLNSQQKTQQLADTKTQVAVEYMRIKDYRAAVSSIEEAVRLNPKSELAWMVKAILYQTLKVNQTADESFKQALKIKPDSAEINSNYGWFICDSLGRPNQSIIFFDKALKDPTYPSPEISYMNKGVCEGRAGRFGAAEMSLAKARALSPNFMPIIKEQARLQLLAHNYDHARRLFETYQKQVDLLSADDLLLGWRIARVQGAHQMAYEYEVQLRRLYPYSDELKSIEGNK